LQQWPLGQFTSGTSEILDRITVGSALRNLQFALIDDIPAYRSVAERAAASP
jgi:hypothetical protein